MSSTFEIAVRRLRALAESNAAMSDHDLLARFSSDSDEAAFATIVERHGAKVFGVCRRVLQSRHDAEDAFQATFLVLARQAKTIHKSSSLGSWLYGVAFRIASRLKRQRIRQSHAPLPDVPCEAPEDVSWREVQRVLDEELNALPERLREPLVLCYLEGLTRDQAAQVLGLRTSTLRGRLEDGREQLRVRLARRGLELSAVLLAISTADGARAISDTLIVAAIRTAMGPVPNTINTLAKGITMTSSLGKMKWLAGMLFTGILGLGAMATMYDDKSVVTPPGVDSANSFTAKEPLAPVDPPAAQVPDKPVPKDPLATLKEMADEADRVWVVKSPRGDKPPEPEEILKGSTPPAKGYSFTFDVAALKKLPADDPDKKWIVFLRSVDEEIDFKPEISPLPRKTWYIPFDPATAAVIKAYVPLMEWGEAKDGLRFGLRLRPDRDEPVVEVALQNVGKVALRFDQFRGNYFDNWQRLHFTIKTPDGMQRKLVRFGRANKDSDAPRDRILQAGETYIHAVRITRWQVERDAKNPKPPEDLFTAKGKFEVTATFTQVLRDEKPQSQWWAGTLTSGAINVTGPVAKAPNPEDFKFDEVRLFEKPGQTPLLYCVLTDAKVDLERSQALVVTYAASALREAGKHEGKMLNVVFFIRQTEDSQVGSYTGFSLEQLNAIKSATLEEAHRLISSHSWSAFGKLPAKQKE